MKLKLSHQDKLKIEKEYYEWLKIREVDFKKIDCPYNVLVFLESKKLKNTRAK
jgi:hypothetical protein